MFALQHRQLLCCAHQEVEPYLLLLLEQPLEPAELAALPRELVAGRCVPLHPEPVQPRVGPRERTPPLVSHLGVEVRSY